MPNKTIPLHRVAPKGAPRTRRTLVRTVKRVILVAGAVVLAAAIVVAIWPGRAPVDTAIATRGPLEAEIREDGQTRVRERFVIAAPINGDLERIELDPGTLVSAGMVVARIQPPAPVLLDARTRGEVAARLDAARMRERQAASTIARATATRDQAVRDAARTRELVERGAITRSELERDELAERIAREDLAAAELQRGAAAAEISALRTTLEPQQSPRTPFDVIAPTSGRILRVQRESSGPVTAGTPLLEIGDPHSLEVVVDVLSSDAERIRPGMPVELITQAPTPVRGTVRVVEPSAFTKVSALGVEEQRVNVIATIDRPPAALGDAYRVEARIITWRGDDVLRVPASALFRDRGEWAVYVVRGGRAHLRHVVVGHRGRLEVEITRGLEVGARVIAHPSDRVHDGVRVATR